MFDGKRVGGLLLMGGTGRRFGSDLPKQFHRLGGKLIFLHTLDAFLACGWFDEVVLSCHADWVEFVRERVPEGVRVVAGGVTRQESSRKGLEGFEQVEGVVIHDAVRPFVSRRILEENVRGLWAGAVDTCIRSADTLVFAPGGEVVAGIPKRADYLRGQTPQSFLYKWIVEAHRTTERVDASDDCQLVLDGGRPVQVVVGDERNMKITSELDLFLAEQLLRLRQEERSGRGGSLEGKKYAVVGATGGIGSAVRERLERLGAEVVGLSRPGLDLRDAESIGAAFERVGWVDGLVNCAGRLVAREVAELSEAEVDELVDVNLKGLILCCKRVKVRAGGHVINVASSSFSRGRKETSVYSAAKAGVVNFTQGWAEERTDLHIHAVIPQRTNTPLRRRNFPHEDPATLLEPEEVAEAVTSLLLEQGMTGLLVEVRKKYSLDRGAEKSLAASRRL